MAKEDASLILDRMVSAGLPHTIRDGCRYFDFNEATNAIKVPTSPATEDVYGKYVLSRRQALLQSGIGSTVTAARMRSGPLKGRACIRFRRSFLTMEVFGKGRPVCRVPFPIATGNQIVSDFKLRKPADAQYRVADGKIDIRLAEYPQSPEEAECDIEYVLTTKLDRSPVDAAGNLVVSCEEDSDHSLYLKPDEGLIHVTPPIDELAKKLASNISNKWQVVNELWRYVRETLKFGSQYHACLVGADPLSQLIDLQWSDCLTGSSLFVALCRALGIPARLVGGLIIHPVAPHYWLEVFLPRHGWITVDTYSWDLGFGPKQELPWRDVFIGAPYFRVEFERPPRIFTGSRGMKLPKWWYIKRVLDPPWTDFILCDATTGTEFIRDSIQIVSWTVIDE